MDKTTGKLLKVGAEAQAMLGQTPGNIIAIRPLREGVISDYEHDGADAAGVYPQGGGRVLRPGHHLCKPGIMEVESALSSTRNRWRPAHLIEEPQAAAIGAGIDITPARDGHMVVISAAAPRTSLSSPVRAW